ncbi:MAG: hypothetical protein IJW82_01505 [Clostridia bacterium]|nr:hypothetical protein [Clostridia bacterium]
MAKQDLMNQTEYKTYLINLSIFAKKYGLVIADLNIIDLTLENFPEIEDKVLTIKNKLGINVEDVLTDDEMQLFLTYLNKALKAYNKKFSVMASKVLNEKNAYNVLYADFTLKKDYARKLLNMDKKGYDQMSRLDTGTSFFLNIEVVSSILKIKQDDFQLLIDRSITYWTENIKNQNK